MGKARTLAGLLAGGGVVRGGGKAQAPLSAPIGRASSPPQAHPTSPREPAGACKSRPVCREPAGPPPALPPALHARAASERLCYKYPKLSLPQAVTAPSRCHPAPSPTCAVIVPRCRPHEPGDYSLVAQIFMHIPLRYLRQHIPLRSLNKTAGSRARTPRMPPAVTNLCSPWR